jgi:hypothetical protein
MQDMRIAEPETRGKDARHKKCRTELETAATGPGLVLGRGLRNRKTATIRASAQKKYWHCACDRISSAVSGTWADCCGTVKQQQSAQVPRRNTGTVLVTGFLLPFLVLGRIVAELE